MKKIKKLLSVILATLSVFALSVNAFAADISAERAKEIALADAGYKAQEVIYINARSDVDDGVKHWDVEFRVEDEKGRIAQYDYEISSDGRIREKDKDYEEARPDADDKLENAFERLFRKIIEWLRALFN